ncbi:hypothetical protein F2P81_016809 [Scophthalmus maximus]|uniref:Uncharacterized protein n=1 Tax=Scophthalmus maximus TaxID=52904 RepID=A0A6A4SCS8_SCOMX|nr:hypothetical protein F2P81_016809 [Scophthalmus maximus]
MGSEALRFSESGAFTSASIMSLENRTAISAAVARSGKETACLQCEPLGEKPLLKCFRGCFQGLLLIGNNSCTWLAKTARYFGICQTKCVDISVRGMNLLCSALLVGQIVRLVSKLVLCSLDVPLSWECFTLLLCTPTHTTLNATQFLHC